MTLPSNVETPHFQNKQSNYTTPLDSPIILNIPYEVALVEFAFREFIQIDIGTLYFKIGDAPYAEFKLIAYENEPKDHFIDRINYEIINYYSKKTYMRDNNGNLEFSEYRADFENEFLNSFPKTESEITHYQSVFNDYIQKSPQFEINSKNQLTCIVKKNTTIKFEGYCR